MRVNIEFTGDWEKAIRRLQKKYAKKLKISKMPVTELIRCLILEADEKE